MLVRAHITPMICGALRCADTNVIYLLNNPDKGSAGITNNIEEDQKYETQNRKYFQIFQGDKKPLNLQILKQLTIQKKLILN